MTNPTAKPCSACAVPVHDGSARCAAHKVRGTFADKRRGSRQSRGYGSQWDRQRLLILERDGGLCQPCARAGRVQGGRTVDHILNKAQGGTDDPANLQTICDPCHASKTHRESLAARGIFVLRASRACTAAGVPTDPTHPWNTPQGGGASKVHPPILQDRVRTFPC